MNLKNLIGNLGTTTTAPAATVEKTASEVSPERVSNAMKAALSSIEAVKTAAAAPGVASDLQKIAAETLAAEKTAEEQHAFRVGEVMADGFAARMETYRAASEDLLKSASTVEGISEEDLAFLKMAKENPEAFLAEVKRGYDETVAQAKQAADGTYQETYDNTVRAIHKTAANHYVAGYNIVRELAAAG